MGNISTYIQTIGERGFDEMPFNEVDGLVLSYLSYYQFEDIVPRPVDGGAITVREAARLYEEKVGESQTTVRTEVLKNMAASVRFSELLLSRRVDVFIPEVTQFSAICVEIPEGPAVLVYRGVDNTLTGWKEAFQFSYKVTPAQTMAKKYLERVAASLAKEGTNGDRRPLFLAGHSKGGNLALYAAVHEKQEVRDSILRLWLYDAPALADGSYDPFVLEEYRDRIMRVVPHFSVLDSIYRKEAPDQIVAAAEEGLLQHEPLDWQVEGEKFMTLDAAAPDALPIRRLVELCILRTSREEKRRFIDTLFRVMHQRKAGGKQTDFGSLGELFLIAVSTWRFADASTRRVVLRFLQSVVQVVVPDLAQHIPIRKKRP